MRLQIPDTRVHIIATECYLVVQKVMHFQISDTRVNIFSILVPVQKVMRLQIYKMKQNLKNTLSSQNYTFS